MKRSTLLIIGLLASLAAEAQIYQYKDASGKTVISDRPPPANIKPRTIGTEATSTTSTQSAPAAAAPSQEKTAADRELDFKKRQQERQDKAAKEQQEQTAAAQRKEECARAQRQLQILESGERVAARDENGERVFMEDTQRTQEIDRMRKIVADICR